MKPLESQPQGHGLLIEPIVVGKDYVFGSYTNLSGEIINESGDWEDYLPEDEYQAPKYETNACTCFGTSSAVETLINFVTGEKVNLSDRMIAAGAGIDPAQGAVPKLAADFIRKNWSAPETLYRMDSADTLQDYYKPVPAYLYPEAKKYQKDYTFGYEFVTPSLANLQEALKRGTVCMSVALMWDEATGKYYRPANWSDTHWVQLVKVYPNGDMMIFDSYPPFRKVIKAGFLPQFAYRYNINEKQVDYIAQAIKAIKDFIANFFPEPETPPATLPMNRSKIPEWALAIQHEEGGKPQDRNMRTHNPGNIKFTEFTKSLGIQKGDAAPDGGHYGKCESYEQGFRALKLFLEYAAEGQLKSYKPTMSIAEFTQVYALPPKNHPYAANVAKRLGVPVTTQIRNLL